MAVAMGFAQLFRGLGQVSGVAISSAIFQTVLRSELVKRVKDLEVGCLPTMSHLNVFTYESG